MGSNSIQRYLPEFVDAYLRNRPLFFALIRPQEAAIFRSLEELLDPPVLDFGCGDGFFTRTVFPERQIEVGIDLEASRIDGARQTGAYRDLRVYDGLHIPYQDAHFGSVISNCVLEHVAELEPAVGEIGRVLRPGGNFLTSVMTNRWEDHLLGARLLGDGYKTFMRARQQHANLLSRADWDRIFACAGFDVESVIGYLGHRTSMVMDAAHYLSAPSLLTHALLGKWVVFPKVWSTLACQGVLKTIELPVDPDESSALFYVLRKAAQP